MLIAVEEAAAAADVVVELAIDIPLAILEVAVVDIGIGMSIPDIEVILAQ
jgi:hypothetical protein